MELSTLSRFGISLAFGPASDDDDVNRPTTEEIMRKAMLLALGLLVMVALPVAADEVKGTVKAVDLADHSIVLDNGTKLTVGDKQSGALTTGDQVRAMYETEGGKNVVTDLGLRGIGSDNRGTTNWGTAVGTAIDSAQAE
jgi:hypothetical protein